MTHSAVTQIRSPSGKESTPNYRQFSFYVVVLNALEGIDRKQSGPMEKPYPMHTRNITNSFLQSLRFHKSYHLSVLT